MSTSFKTKSELNIAVEKLGAKLTQVLKSRAEALPLFICLEEEAFIFFSDLIRSVNLDIHCDFIHKEKIQAFLNGEEEQIQNLKQKTVVFVTLNLNKWQQALPFSWPAPAQEALRSLGVKAEAEAIWLVEFCAQEGLESLTDFYALKIPRFNLNKNKNTVDFFESLTGYGLNSNYKGQIDSD